MAKYGAIVRTYFDDEVKDYKLHGPEPNLIYELFLYEEIKKGSMPKYKITGSDKSSVLTYAVDIMNRMHVKKVNDGKHYFTTDDTSMYNSPICVDIETGEFVE